MTYKSPEIFEYAKNLREEGLSYQKIANKIKEELGETISPETIRLRLKGKINKALEGIRKLNNEIEYTNPFEFEGDNVVFYKKVRGSEVIKKISIPIDEVKQIREDYVEVGANLTGQEIMEKYNLNPEARHLLKNRLGLYKKSNIIPDWLLEKIEKEQGEDKAKQVIEEVSHKAAHSKYKRLIVKRYNRAKNKEYERAITTLYSIENLLENLSEYLETYKPEKFKDYDNIIALHEQNKDLNFNDEIYNNNLYATITDIHIGKKNTGKIYDRLMAFADTIIKAKENNIKLFILGDLAEILVEGGRHPGQIESMDGPYGFDLIMEVVNVLEDVITFIYEQGKDIEIFGITGNHGALSKEKGGDIQYTGELVIYELIKRGISNLGIKLEYLRNTRNTVDTKDFCFIVNHGTGPQTKKKPHEILWEFGKNNKENIILQGDKHSARLENVSKNGTRIIVPALAGPNVYDENLGVSSYTGFTLIRKGYNGKPKVEFIFLD